MEALDGNILYINVMNRLSVDYDCDENVLGSAISVFAKEKIHSAMLGTTALIVRIITCFLLINEKQCFVNRVNHV